MLGTRNRGLKTKVMARLVEFMVWRKKWLTNKRTDKQTGTVAESREEIHRSFLKTPLNAHVSL